MRADVSLLFVGGGREVMMNVPHPLDPNNNVAKTVTRRAFQAIKQEIWRADALMAHRALDIVMRAADEVRKD